MVPPVRATPRRGGSRVAGRGSRVATPRARYAEAWRSKTAMLSTCAVWGNMLITPAAVQR